MYKLMSLVICFIVLFAGVSLADDVGVSSIVVDKDGASIGYVMDSYGTSAAIILGPSLWDSSYEWGFLGGDISVPTFVRYNFANRQVGDENLGAGIALKAGLFNVDFVTDWTVSALLTADMDIATDNFGIDNGKFGIGAMVDSVIVTW